MRKPLIVTLALLSVMLPRVPARANDPRDIRLTFTRANDQGLSSPVALASPNDGTNRIMVVEQAGRIRVRMPDGHVNSTPYLDIQSRVNYGGERGLLGLAFHPSFKSNRYLFVFYTDSGGDLRIVRFRAASYSSQTVSSSTGVTLLKIEHSANSNHNGGQLQFGSDGYLYISTGDGGGGGDPSNNGQDRTTRLGKILRIDVNRGCAGYHYCTPSSNPYKTHPTFKHDIWQWGLRNAWRFSFDASTHNQWIADVGQNALEEINRIEEGVGGRNLGWDCREGTATFSTASYCSGKTFTYPVKQYTHSSGRCAIVGGYVYRGTNSILQAIYLYADYCTGEVWGLRFLRGTWVSSLVYDHNSNITSFGQTVKRNLYVVDTSGNMYLIGAVPR